MYAKLALTTLLAGCSFFEPRTEEPKPSDPDLLPELVDTARLYCQLSEPKYQERKYVHSRCDGAAFTSLRAVACGLHGFNVDLSVFTDPATGKLYRDPEHSCLATGESASDSSKDMFLMRLVAAFEQRDIVWYAKFAEFAEANHWIICAAKDELTRISRCAVSISLIRLFYDSYAKAKGEQPLRLESADDDMDASGLPRGFEAHLQMLRVWLTGRVYGAISESELAVAAGQAAREPSNALYQAIFHHYSDGVQTAAYSLLRSRFPAGRLPTNHKDWCEEYLFQRDETEKDWSPCPSEPASEHSGTDLAFTVYILGKT